MWVSRTGDGGVSLDLTQPDPTRMIDYWLGGTHHFEVDRAMARQIRFHGLGEAGQEKLMHSTVAIVGCGALGSFQAGAMARAGVAILIALLFPGATAAQHASHRGEVDGAGLGQHAGAGEETEQTEQHQHGEHGPDRTQAGHGEGQQGQAAQQLRGERDGDAEMDRRRVEGEPVVGVEASVASSSQRDIHSSATRRLAAMSAGPPTPPSGHRRSAHPWWVTWTVLGAVILLVLPQAISFIQLPPSVMGGLQGVLYTLLVLIFIFARPQGLVSSAKERTSGGARMISATMSARSTTGIPRRRASASSAFDGRTADDITTTSASPTVASCSPSPTTSASPRRCCPWPGCSR